MSGFFRYPHTPHLAWLGPGMPRDDKLLTPSQGQALLRGDVIVEEKVDGANVGFSLDEHGEPRAQNRGAYIRRDSCHPQFEPLFRWLAPRCDALRVALAPGLMLFGEWCWAVHSVRYTALPDWFLAFDVFDRAKGEFWSVDRRNELAGSLGLAVAPRLAQGHFDLPGIVALLGPSRLGSELMEGVYIRRDEAGRSVARAKLVQAQFTQSVDGHWSRRRLEHNALKAPRPSATRERP